MKKLKLVPFAGSSTGDIMAIEDLNLVHDLWQSYIREIVGDMAGDAQLQARYVFIY